MENAESGISAGFPVDIFCRSWYSDSVGALGVPFCLHPKGDPDMTIQLSDHFTYSRLLRFTLPSIAMMIFTSIYGVVDTISAGFASSVSRLFISHAIV